MPHEFTVTGNPLGDFAIAALVFVAGLLWAVKGGSKFGWLLLAAGLAWAVLIGRVFLH